MTTKSIVVAVAGAGKEQFRDVQLMPATKARDVLIALGLQGMALSKPDGGEFGHNDDLFQAVADGQKLYAKPSDVRAGF